MAFHGFNMIGWAINIGGRNINKNSNSAKMSNGSYLWNGNIWGYFLGCNQPIKLQWPKLWIFPLIIVWLNYAYTYVAQSNKWNYYLSSLLYQRFWLGSHTLAVYTYNNREVEHSFDDYYSDYYTERAFEWYQALLYLYQNRWVKNAMRYHSCLWISNLTEIHFS